MGRRKTSPHRGASLATGAAHGASRRRCGRRRLLKLSFCDGGRNLVCSDGLGLSGVVAQGFGAGHVPSGVVAQLEMPTSSMPVARRSRTGTGEPLLGSHGFPGSEANLLSRGPTSAGALGGRKARFLVSLITLDESDCDVLRQMFESVVASVTPLDPTFT